MGSTVNKVTKSRPNRYDKILSSETKKEFKECVEDFKRAVVNCANTQERKNIMRVHMEDLMDLGLEAQQAMDWSLKSEIDTRIYSMQQRTASKARGLY